MRRAMRAIAVEFGALAVALLVSVSPARAQVSPGPLARPHAQLEGNSNCLKCHAAKKVGMDERCLACHKPIAALRAAGRGFHARDGKGSCAKCHPDHAGVEFALVDWPKDGPPGFDHAASAGYALAGKHAKLACRDCHQSKNRQGSFASSSWLGLTADCKSCHADPHKGALGDDCARCHKPVAWADVSGFDHTKTAYPLTGKHATVKCEACHRPAGATQTVLKPLPHAECVDCHKDAHAGRLGPKCASCHATTGFLVVAAGSFDHERTRYPLKGAHRAVACTACHVPGRPDRQRPPFATCASCHADPHAGQGTLAGARVDCSACHDLTSYKISTFSVARHASTPFALEGKHAGVACAACHHSATPDAARLGRANVLMRPRHDACATCHADAHGGQLASRADRGACESCHTAAAWAPSRPGAVEHAKLKVTLDGGHARLACGGCHGAKRKELPPPADAARAGKAGFVFARLETDCAGCHRDPHGFKDRACTPCHGAAAWSPSTVGPSEHARYGFPLDGAHRAVGCEECHKELVRPAGKRSSLLAATGTLPALPLRDPRRACADCHASPHGTQFASRKDGGRCESCHGVEAFRPASRFSHDRDTSFALGRAHAAVPCARCHAPARDAAGHPSLVYRGVDPRCESCHKPQGKSGGTS